MSCIRLWLHAQLPQQCPYTCTDRTHGTGTDAAGDHECSLTNHARWMFFRLYKRVVHMSARMQDIALMAGPDRLTGATRNNPSHGPQAFSCVQLTGRQPVVLHACHHATAAFATRCAQQSRFRLKPGMGLAQLLQICSSGEAKGNPRSKDTHTMLEQDRAAPGA